MELKQRIEELLGPLPFLLVVNKTDLRDEWEILPADLTSLAEENWSILESSAKTGDGVEQAFLTLTERMLQE